jgi:hypothetical protein
MFHETQKPRQWWIAAIILGIAALMWWAFVQQIILGHTVGSNPAPDALLIVLWIVVGIGFPLGWLRVRMITCVNADTLTIRYAPFMTRQIPLDEIAGFGVRTYDPVHEYGGWGIRMWFGGQRAYNVSGNRGVDVILHNGDRILIGSQRPRDLAQALDARLG